MYNYFSCDFFQSIAFGEIDQCIDALFFVLHCSFNSKLLTIVWFLFARIYLAVSSIVVGSMSALYNLNIDLGICAENLTLKFSLSKGGGSVVQWLGRWVCMRLFRFKSRSNLWLEFVSGCP